MRDQPQFRVLGGKVIREIASGPDLKVEMTPRCAARRPDLTDLIPCVDAYAYFHKNGGKVGVQGKKIIGMLNNNHIAVEIRPRAELGGFIRICKDDFPISRRVDGCAKSVLEFHAMMRIPFSVLGGGVEIGQINELVTRRQDGTLKEKAPVYDAEVRCQRVTGNGCWG